MSQRIGRPYRHHTSPRRLAAALVATALTTTGCQGMAMTHEQSQSTNVAPQQGPLTEFPLRFLRHNFGIATYAVQEYTVIYANRPYSGGPRPAREDVHPNSFNAIDAGHISIRNFPAPAIVRWKARDGTPLETEVDIGEIFKDELVLYDAPRDEISDRTPAINPDIVMEIDDRTINVYMRAHLSLKAPRIPGNRYSNFRADLVQAWSKTY